jgi:hypothetical protein
MATPVSYGFLRPDPSRVMAGTPAVASGDSEVPVNGTARAWDYLTPVRVAWQLRVDLDGIRTDCGLTERSVLAGIITWHSSWTGLRGGGRSIPLNSGENVLNLELPGEVLGGRLRLEAQVVLAEHDPGAPPPAPQRPGSHLWRAQALVVLEGSASRMPTVPVDFGTEYIAGGGNGAWYLDCDTTDLAASAGGAVILYLNTGHRQIREMLDTPSTERSKLIMSGIKYDVTRQLVLVALHHEQLTDSSDLEAGTLGAMLRGLLRRYFPSRPLHQLRADYEGDPGEFEAELQAKAWTVEQ